jgi:YVTN family beta-propeller protein
VAVNSDGSRIYLTISPSGVAVIDGFTNEVITHVPAGHDVGHYPNHIVVHPDNSKIYVGNRAAIHDGISVIDATTNTLITDILIGQGVDGMALTPDGSKLYAVTSGSTPTPQTNVVVINTTTNQVAQTLRLADVSRLFIEMAMHPDGSTVYVSGFDIGAVINTTTDTLQGSFSAGANSLAVHPDGSKIYLTSNDND